ncbi:MAG: SLC13 family permease [Anaerolineaceae bacterium]|nr:SLC13 family permease [Anaerolineaceae bacterium]
MNDEILLMLLILGASIILFISEILRADVVAIISLILLILSGLITPEEGFSGFSNPAVITVWSVFIISGGLNRSGVADIIAHYMVKISGRSMTRLIIVIMGISGLMSAFMNNIGAVAILLPAVISISRKVKISPSKLLLPLSWAALLGGNLTLIGTPPNILAANLLSAYGQPPFEFFDFAPMGLIFLAAGILYAVILGRFILPERVSAGELSQKYHLSDYLTEIQVEKNSPFIGKTIRELKQDKLFDLNIIQLHHNELLIDKDSQHKISKGDILVIKATAQDLIETRKSFNIASNAIRPFTNRNLESLENFKLVELVLSPKSRFAGLSLNQINFTEKYGLSILAIRSRKKFLTSRLLNVSLGFRDAIIVGGDENKIDLLRNDRNFLVLETNLPEPKKLHKAPLSVIIILSVIAAILFNLLEVQTAMFIGASAMVVLGILKIDEAYRAIDWKSVFLIACMLPMGIAMQKTGTAAFLAEKITLNFGNFGPKGIMIGVYIMTTILTEVISNAAATVLVVPIAIDIALTNGLNIQSMVMAVVLAASSSFIMPIGHQVNIIIYGPGGYKFSDYIKSGSGLVIILIILVFLLLPLFWPLV